MILKLKNIDHKFSGSRKILDGVSCQLERGTIYALMGANGSGKTTLFNIITGFIKPQSGGILFEGRQINGLAPFKINRLGIGRTFQDLRLISKLSVRENVVLAMHGHPTQGWHRALLPRSLYKNSIDSFKTGADEILETCFINDVKNSLAGEISYGQQKLLNLACCVANDAKVLLLDEPIAGINTHYREQILVLLEKLRGVGKCILLIEHNTEFLQQIADRFFFLKNGSLKAYDTFDQLKEDREVLEAYLSA